MNSIKVVRRFMLAAGVIFFVLFPWVVPDPSLVSMLITCGIASMVTMSWIMILRVGHLSLGQVAFLAVGAYTSAVVVTKFHVSPWLGLLASGVVTALIALGIGYVVLRIRGLYFSIMTFAFAEVIRLGISNSKYLGGAEGISGIPVFSPIPLPGWGPMQFESASAFYYLMLFLLALAAAVFWRIDRSGLGRTCRAVALNESLSQSLGVNVLQYKLLAFVSACFFAGIAGGFSAHYYRCLDPTSYTVVGSVLIQIQATVGGVGSILAGGILGATLMTLMDHFLISIDPRLITISAGIIILAFTFFLPQGVISLPQVLRRGGSGPKESTGPRKPEKSRRTTGR